MTVTGSAEVDLFADEVSEIFEFDDFGYKDDSNSTETEYVDYEP